MSMFEMPTEIPAKEDFESSLDKAATPNEKNKEITEKIFRNPIRPIILRLSFSLAILLGNPSAGMAGQDTSPTVDTSISSKTVLSLEQKKEKLLILFGKEAQEILDSETSYKIAEVREQKEKIKISEVKGLGQDNKEITLNSKNIFKILKTFPSSWKSNIKGIIQTEEQPIFPEKYGIKGAPRGTFTKDGFIKFFASTKSEYLYFVFTHLLPHEFAHASEEKMTPHKRMDLLFQLADRVRAEDRYRSYYVESIKNIDKQAELLCKSQEYWAEICTEYFNNPHQLPYRDFEIVDRHVKESNPNFNAEKSGEKRRSMLIKLLKNE